VSDATVKSEPAGKHSRLPPSSSGRWVPCTASIGFIEANTPRLPKQDWTFAERGTRAHDAGAQLILDPKSTVRTDDAEMLTTVSAYAEFVRDKIRPGDRVLVEKKIRLFYLPTEKGTTDAAIIGPKTIYIADYKDGVGVSVYARNNTQLAIYAESLIQELELIEEIADDTLVTLAIYQPRDRFDPNPARIWALSRKDLRDFCDQIMVARDQIHASKVDLEGRIEGPAQFKAGPHCDKSFCPARGLCKAYGAMGLTAISDDPVDVTIAESKLVQLRDPNTLTRHQRMRVIAAKPALIAWLEAVENQEVHELMSGAAPDQFKMVSGKSPGRVWNNETKAEELLKTLLDPKLVKPPVEPSLISPTQAEKLLKGSSLSEEVRASLSALIDKPEGKPSLVPVTDKRPALSFNPTEGLSKIEESDKPDASALI
jgi:hypothetical protein